MTASNSAAWLKSEKADLVVGPAQYPTAGPHEVVIKNLAIGLMPLEFKLQKLAIFPLAYPDVILGTSYAGVVEEAGESSELNKGDRVVVRTDFGPPNAATWGPKYSSHQKYVVAKVEWISKMGDKTSFQDAAGTNVNLATAVGALSAAMGVEKPTPPNNTKPSVAKKILIYGGSSNVGSLSIQYALSAGLTVITTSSPHNKAFVQSLEPPKIIDHTLPSTSLLTAIEAEGLYDYIFDTISLPKTISLLSKYLSTLSGGAIYTTQPFFGAQEIPSNVELKFFPIPLCSSTRSWENESVWCIYRKD